MSPEIAKERPAPIVNGIEPTDAEATVTLGYYVWGNFRSTCSGSLVAPNVVLTAKHCIPAWWDCDARWLTAGFGPVGLDRQIRTVGAVCSENSCTTDCPPNWNFAYEDIALVVLEEDVDDITPYTIPWDGDEVDVGDVLALRGYGLTEAQTAGRRYETQDEVTEVLDDELMTEGNGVCSGDSGGTAVDEAGNVVGILVRGPNDGCIEPPPARRAYLTRVTYWLDVVEEAFAMAEQCTPVSVEGCDGWDNDCDGVVDEGCGLEGDACDPTASVCTDGLYCRVEACGEATCAQGEPGETPRAEPCGSDSDCETLRCVDSGDGAVCTAACAPGAGDCGVGEVCSGPDASCAVCVDASLAPPGARGLGEPCRESSDCIAGACIGTIDGRVCADACVTEEDGSTCPSGYHCLDGLCRRGDPGLPGDPCNENEECASGLCGRWAEGDACTARCGDETPCPERFECDGGYCRSEAAILGEPCQGNDDCLSGLCGRFAGGDRCTEICDAWTACPSAFECVDATGGVQICARHALRAAGGACRVGDAPGPLGALVFLVLFVRRGRRAQ